MMTEEQSIKMFHDLKNDLAAMTALINLHKLYKSSISTEEILNRLYERQTVIATAYEKMYQENDYPFISLRGFTNDLIQRENRTLADYCSNIRIKKEIADIRLPIKRAMPFTQILIELISNSHRHAFKETTGEKNISFRLTEDDNKLTLEYSDNGCGLPEGFKPEKSGTLGMQLIYSLSRQLGCLTDFVSDSPGMMFKLKT